MSDQTCDLTSDAPLLDEAEDRLGRRAYAERVAHEILAWQHESSLVVGVLGSWGSGKTSAMHFTREAIPRVARRPFSGYEKRYQDRPIQLWFSPWMIGGEETLVRELLLSLRAEITRETESTLENWKRRAAGACGAITKYGNALLNMAATVGAVAVPVMGGATKVFRAGIEVAKVAKASSAVNIDELKKRVSDAIKALDRRVVIYIDDFDRLDPPQMRVMLRIVRAVADFDHITYVIGADPQVVGRAIDVESDPEEGARHLDKFIHLPLRLPPPGRVEWDQWARQEFRFDEHLSSSDKGANTRRQRVLRERLDEAFQLAVHGTGSAPLLCTPRQLKRASRVFTAKWRSLEGNVNAADLMLLSCLEAVSPAVYDRLVEHHWRLVPQGIDLLTGRLKRSDSATNYGEDLLRLLIGDSCEANHEPVSHALRHLFPLLRQEKLEDYKAPTGAGQAQRVCSPDYVAVFFQYDTVLGGADDRKIDELLEWCCGTDSDYSRGQALVAAAANVMNVGSFMSGLELRSSGAAVPVPALVRLLECLAVVETAMFSGSRDVWGGPQAIFSSLLMRVLSQVPTGDQKAVADRVIDRYQTLPGVLCIYRELAWPHPENHEELLPAFQAKPWNSGAQQVCEKASVWRVRDAESLFANHYLAGSVAWLLFHTGDGLLKSWFEAAFATPSGSTFVVDVLTSRQGHHVRSIGDSQARMITQLAALGLHDQLVAACETVLAVAGTLETVHCGNWKPAFMRSDLAVSDEAEAAAVLYSHLQH